MENYFSRLALDIIGKVGGGGSRLASRISTIFRLEGLGGGEQQQPMYQQFRKPRGCKRRSCYYCTLLHTQQSSRYSGQRRSQQCCFPEAIACNVHAGTQVVRSSVTAAAARAEQAVFNYEFDSLTHDDPVIAAVYTALREAEYRWGSSSSHHHPEPSCGMCLQQVLSSPGGTAATAITKVAAAGTACMCFAVQSLLHVLHHSSRHECVLCTRLLPPAGALRPSPTGTSLLRAGWCPGRDAARRHSR
jgi:hypothetical protein